MDLFKKITDKLDSFRELSKVDFTFYSTRIITFYTYDIWKWKGSSRFDRGRRECSHVWASQGCPPRALEHRAAEGSMEKPPSLGQSGWSSKSRSRSKSSSSKLGTYCPRVHFKSLAKNKVIHYFVFGKTSGFRKAL